MTFFRFIVGLVVSGLTLITAQQTVLGNWPTVTLCENGPGRNSTDSYCTCSSNAISCDFDSLQTDNELEIRFVKGYESESIKRLCFCGGPDKLHLYLNISIPISFPKLHRVDFYNISGFIHLHNAFSNYFSGDVYMEQVRVNTIHSLEFGRGNTFTIEDTSDIQCCSKITSKQKLSRPVLHIENTRIGLIESSGINSFHMWSSFVMTNVTVARIERNGISLDNRDINVSLTDCRFEVTNATSINVNYAANFFMGRNVFTDKCHPLSFGSVSTLARSTVVLLENYFNNSMVIRLDAKKVVMWLNHFDRWDNDTFHFVDQSGHTDRILSMQYNVVEDITDFTPNDIPSTSNLRGEALILDSNVLGYCDCSSQKKLSPMLTNSKCQTLASKAFRRVCHLQIDEAQKNCRSQGVCVSGQENYFQQLKEFFHKHRASLDSGFISDTLSSNPIRYKLTGIARHVPGKIEYSTAGLPVTFKFGFWNLIGLVVGIIYCY